MFRQPAFGVEIEPCLGEASDNAGDNWSNSYEAQDRWRAAKVSAESNSYLDSISPETTMLEIPQLECQNDNEKSASSGFWCFICSKTFSALSEYK